MNLKRAHYIIAICEAGSVTAAAKKLFISQPSLSQTLRLVEQELGAAIFERGSTPLKPTYAGEQYLATARAMLVQEENLSHILEGIHHEERGRLRIGISIQRGPQLLPLVLPAFTQQFPDVQLILEETGSKQLEQMADEGRVDLSLTTTEPTNSRLEYILIETESIGLLVGKDNHLARRYEPGDEIPLSAAANESFMALKPDHNIRWLQDRFFAESGISPKILAETDSVEAAIRITTACNCCMLCPHAFVRSNPALAGNGIYYRLKSEHISRHFYACYRKDNYQPRYVRAFIDLVQEATRNSVSGAPLGAAGA